MEDPSEEWEIVDYSSYLEDGDTEKSSSRLSWILSGCLSLGKKLVITGVVISSVPLFLPPLIVMSALGVAFSVPFGVVFASYAGTQKLMSKLLPPPPSPYQEMEEDEIDFEREEEKYFVATEEEGKEWKDETQMRIELVEDVDESLEVGTLEGKGDDEVYVGGVNKEERGQDLLELSKDEKPSSATKTDDQVVIGDTTVAILEVETNKSMETEGQKVVQVKNEREDQTVTEVKGTEKGKKRQTVSKGKSSSKETEKRGKMKTLTAPKLFGKKKEPEGDKKHEKLRGKDKDSSKKSGPEVVIQETSIDELTSVSSGKEKGGSMVPGSEGLDTHQTWAENVDKISQNNDVGNIEKEQQPGGMKKSFQGQNVEASPVMNEETRPSGVVISGEAFMNDKGSEKDHEQVNNDRGVTEDDDRSRTIAVGGGSSVEVTTVTAVSELTDDEEIPDLKGVEDDFGSAEVLSCDEDIWKKIDAIRGIVGLKSPRRPLYFEELKALYLFTGIEPPSSSIDSSSDLSEFYNKLAFLMTVIGVK